MDILSFIVHYALHVTNSEIGNIVSFGICVRNQRDDGVGHRYLELCYVGIHGDSKYGSDSHCLSFSPPNS